MELQEEVQEIQTVRSKEGITMDDLLLETLERGASDLHICAGVPPIIRLHGELLPLDYPHLDPEDTQRLIYEILTPEQKEGFEKNKEYDLPYSIPGKARFRADIYYQRKSVSGAFRWIPIELRTLEELGLPRALEEFTKKPRGFVLVTGPTGSGKSTTLAALIDIINNSRSLHIITVEDPIEFLHRHKKSVVNQREVGSDTHSFKNALKYVLRQDPDVILIGEMRDVDTIGTALTAAETGHLVFSTLHTQDAPQTIDRIIDVFPPHQQEQIRVQLAGTLQGIISQQLLPHRDGKGRVPAVEVLICNSAVRNLIREGKPHQIYTIMQTSSNVGMQTMDQSLAELYKKGKITRETALSRAVDPENLKRLMMH
jgi:twitching motility protein PilT